VLFQTDARLRPDGQKGLLVNHLNAYEEYYLQRAQLWEIQSLARAGLWRVILQSVSAFSEWFTN
jgi:glutamine synthetase adenylyltransferase